MKQGIYPELSNGDYHADPALSHSMMEKLRKSPAHFKYYRENPGDPTNAMMFGSAYHCKILQPHLFHTLFEVVPKGGYKTLKDGKITIPETNKVSGGYDDILAMAKALRERKVVSNLLSGGEAEVSYFWTHKLGFSCKARPDYRKGNILIDLKTTIDASPEAFAKAIANFGYHRQGDWYMHGVAANKVEAEHFIIIAQEKKPPYEVGIYRLQEEDLYLAHIEDDLLCQKYEECSSTGNWSGYSHNIENISLPQWAVKQAKI